MKTSKVKLENKLKNKQFKQQSTLKKYRKEQRKLRQAVKDAVSKKPIPLEDPKEKRPGNCENIPVFQFLLICSKIYFMQ